MRLIHSNIDFVALLQKLISPILLYSSMLRLAPLLLIIFTYRISHFSYTEFFAQSHRLYLSVNRVHYRIPNIVLNSSQLID